MAETTATESGVWSGIVGLFGGGALAVVFRSIRDAFVARLRNREEMARQEAERERGEREESMSIAIEERTDRRRMEAEIKELRERLLSVSVEVASLRTQIDLQQQLIERQRQQIDGLVRRLMEGAA